MSLKVGLNLAYLVEDSGGSGTYARELLPHLLLAEREVELTAWIGTTAPGWLAHEPWAREVRWIRMPVPGVGSPWHLWHELAGIGLDARRRGLDVVHGLAFLAPLVHPGVATVVTILDVIWTRQWQAEDARFRLVMGTLAPLVGRRSSRIIAISNAARDEVSTALGLDASKFDVAPLGISAPPAFERGGAPRMRERLGLGPEPIVLCVAAKRAHKNLAGLIHAIALLRDAPALAPHAHLVLPGSPNEHERELRELAQELDVQGSVSFPGWLADSDLEDLYRIASCFVLPSFEEGFGLPVLEAMVRGVPVACSDIPALSEVAGGAALLFSPRDPSSIALAIRRIIGDHELAQELVARGRTRCEAFTWERTAQATLASYGRALAGA